jgi:hypothetical protein
VPLANEVSCYMSEEKPMRLEISGLLQRAEQIEKTIHEKLGTHSGLKKAAFEITAAAKTAEHLAQKMQRTFSVHHLPVLFLGAALFTLAAWSYWKFIYVSTVHIALPDRDASVLREKVRSDKNIKLEHILVTGSTESIKKLRSAEADVAFVQGGVEIPKDMLRLETQDPETILFLMRPNQDNITTIRTVITSTMNEGSQSVARDFFARWGVKEVQYLHEWKGLTAEAPYSIPPGVDAVFVVKDPSEETTLRALRRLYEAGFELRPPALGARAAKLEYLTPIEIQAGFFESTPQIPQETLNTYTVTTYLVARPGLTPRLLASAAALLEKPTATITQQSYALTASEIGNVFGAIGDVLEVLLDIVLAFLALLGLDMAFYRKRFHELNSLISLLSMLQSSKDVIDIEDETKKQEHLLYLRLCSDLLSLISAITGYYTQENSSLSFNSLSETIHQRCDGLKINIQLKILHAGL